MTGFFDTQRAELATATATATARRVRVRVGGVVQGVGYRPFVVRLALGLGLVGWVRNDARGVLLEAEGAPEAIAALLRDLRDAAPPLARVEWVAVEQELGPAGAPTGDFAIVGSDATGAPDALVAADGAPCADCLAELFDPADRRHRYPFINCTNCGPRFTIVRGVPYDRPQTTMAGFAMCARCQAEYDDPGDRRFHAQPNACPACGPRLQLVGALGTEPAQTDGDAIAAAAALLQAGAIVAVKGVGGYHLACRADHERAVATLRARKHRADKPFALMVDDLDAADDLVELDAAEAALLRSVARPVVLARRRPDAPVAAAVAPVSAELGLMLPCSPLHHLLLAEAGRALVMTSGNVSDEPIAYRDADARRRLARVADATLVHDRPIHMRTDDSVVRVVAGRETVLRRSRGYVPERLALPAPVPAATLACGAQLKSTFCVARGDRAWVSHHIGDLDDAETRRSFAEGIAHFERLFAVAPELVVCDRHPDYASTAYALEREGVDVLQVGHHHAHLAAVLAEHGLDPDTRAVGAIYDGSGLGEDGTVWGGELLVGDQASSRRAGHLLGVPQPGGDRAARQPWRMAAAWLLAANGHAEPDPPIPHGLRGQVHAEDWATVCAMARRGFSSPTTSSMGRLFDALAALCGVRATCTYEGQAAIEFEALAAPERTGGYALPVCADAVLDARPLVRAVAGDAAAGVPAALISARAHRAVAEATVTACARLASAHATDRVVLAGGVFANRVLLAATVAGLEAAGLCVLVPRRLPAGDGAISFGQVATAAARTPGRAPRAGSG